MGSKAIDQDFIDKTVLTTATAAAIIGITPEHLQILHKHGWIRRKAANQWVVGELVQGYVQYLRDEQRKNTKAGTYAEVQKARAKEIELRTAREAGQLILVEQALDAINGTVGPFKVDMISLPARVTRDIPLRRKIEAEVNGILTAHAKRLRETSAALRSGSGPDRTPAAD